MKLYRIQPRALCGTESQSRMVVRNARQVGPNHHKDRQKLVREQSLSSSQVRYFTPQQTPSQQLSRQGGFPFCIQFSQIPIQPVRTLRLPQTKRTDISPIYILFETRTFKNDSLSLCSACTFSKKHFTSPLVPAFILTTKTFKNHFCIVLQTSHNKNHNRK